MMKNRAFNIIFLVVALVAASCQQSFTPKPYGYVRIDVPDTAYTAFNEQHFPYSFHLSDNAQIEYRNEPHEKYWIDIKYPQYKAAIHCSYKSVDNNLGVLTDEAQKFVYKHAQMASAIPERGYENEEEKVYGVMYEIQGNTASPFQFILTDSTTHFFRGALYFNCTPNQDSLAPVIEYMRTDIIELIESFKWQ